MGLAHQDHFGRRLYADQSSKRAQRFGDPFVRLQEPENADEGRGFIDTQAVAEFRPAGFGNPGAVRDGRDGSRKSRPA